jgi:hypothetical protein
VGCAPSFRLLREGVLLHAGLADLTRSLALDSLLRHLAVASDFATRLR